jgi:hypothetical protein
MTIAFDQALAQWQGTPPITSPNFTPAAAGEVILPMGAISAPGFTITYAGSTGTYFAGTQHTVNSNCLGNGYGTGLTAASQTCTLGATVEPGFQQAIMALLYSGVATISTSDTPTGVVNPGTGTGACTAPAILVPINSVLVACCMNVAGATETITSPTGTQRASQGASINYCAVDYAGTGANVTAAFTCPLGAAATYYISLWLLSPPAAPVLTGYPLESNEYY